MSLAVHRPLWTVVALLVATTAGCGSDGGSPAAGDADGASARIRVVASFYPLEFVVARVGGQRVDVTNITPAGVEPHDLEITADGTARIDDADLVVYLAGFSPAVDGAVDAVGGENSLDVTDAARLERRDSDVDPHFWLDPLRLADVADVVAARLADIAPAGMADFTAGAAALRAELERLDESFRTGLTSCASTAIVTSHEAFGYLASRYGLTQVGIAGLTPDAEPSPDDLARVANFVDEHGVTTIFYETLVSPDIAATIADETGAVTAVLDPIEGLAEAAGDVDYFDVMAGDLAALRTGLGCA